MKERISGKRTLLLVSFATSQWLKLTLTFALLDACRRNWLKQTFTTYRVAMISRAKETSSDRASELIAVFASR